MLRGVLLHPVPAPDGCVVTHGDEDVTVAREGSLADGCHTLGVSEGGATGLRWIANVQVPYVGPAKLVPHGHHLQSLDV